MFNGNWAELKILTSIATTTATHRSSIQSQKAEACQLKSVDVVVVPHSGLGHYRVGLLRAGRHPARFQQEQRAVSV
jgi:hypothetical protein